ncbi:hypothetical protein H4582DRAFT_531261 [Lactarius indigo]|nr:hypothetical protein H4582DRAFT_531261 [Lactarius indigo]
MAGSSLPPEEITKIAAPLLFGPLVNWALYGVLSVQTYVYSYNFPNDRLLTKSLVYFVFALETTQTALTGADVYFWFVGGFGDFERLKNSHYAPIDIPLTSTVISLLVQMYFCYRIWTLTKNVSLCGVITVTSVASAIGSAWGGFASVIVGKYAVSKAALYLWSIPSAVADILIATAMTLLLRRTRATEGLFSRFVLVRVVRVTIETNMLTASVAIASFVLYVAFPNEIYYTFTAGIIGKLYSNTLLVSLNNRIYFRDHVSGSSGDGDTSRLTVSSRARNNGITSIFSRGEPQLRAPVEVFKLETTTTSNARDLEHGKGDSASINSDPSHSPGDVIHIKTGQGIPHSSTHD